MIKIVIVPLILLSCCRNIDNTIKDRKAGKDAVKPDTTLVKQVGLDSVYRYADQALHGDIGNVDYEEIREMLGDCAAAHDPRCATLLGYHLVKGFKLEKDIELGVSYLSEAARLNQIEAILYLSDFYYENAQADSSTALLEKAYELGYSDAAYILSEIYLRGINVRLGRPELRYNDLISTERGIAYLHLASEKSLEAKFSLANYHLTGFGNFLSRDTGKSVVLLKEVLSDAGIDSIPGFRDRVEMKLATIKGSSKY